MPLTENWLPFAMHSKKRDGDGDARCCTDAEGEEGAADAARAKKAARTDQNATASPEAAADPSSTHKRQLAGTELPIMVTCVSHCFI